MSVENATIPAVDTPAHRASFFRQSGWLMVANIAGGMLMWAVHPLAKATGPKEYGIFIAFLSLAMCIPAGPLQIVLAHQTAQALATRRERQLAGIVRLIWIGTGLVWLVMAVIGFCLRDRIIDRWQLTNPAALWISLPVLLLSFWFPVFSGVLQGQQKFLGLGWSMILNGVGRLAIAAFGVLVLRGYATAMMTGVLLGLLVAVLIASWLSRSAWLGPTEPFDWRSLLREVVPLMLGAGAFQFLFTADTMFVKAYFTADEVGFYGSAGTLSRALMWMVGPLATVMFPRIVHSAAKAEKTNLMTLVLIGTAVLSISGAFGLSIVGPWLVKFIYDPSWVKVAASVLPWYAAAMVPLGPANVLMSNLLARSSFKVVPALCLLAGGYAFALTRFHDSLVMVLQTLGICNLVLLLVCAWFTWGFPDANRSQLAAPQT